MRTNIPAERAARIAGELQRIRDALAGSLLRCAYEGEKKRLPVTVLSLSQFHDVAPGDMDGQFRSWSITWLADYEGQIVLPDDLGRDTRQVYQHELAHVLIASCLPRVPTWLDEGLAKFIETAVVTGGRVTFGVPPYRLDQDSRRPALLRSRGVRTVELAPALLPPVERVVAMREDDFIVRGPRGSTATEANYAAAWALVHLFEVGDPVLGARFREYLAALRHREGEPEALFADAFDGIRLQKRLDTYVDRGVFRTVSGRAEAPRRAAPRVRRMEPGEIHLHWAWLWSSAPDRAAGRRRTLEHLAAAKRDPATRTRAHLMAAALRLFERDPAGAEREVAHGLRAAPSDPALLHAYVEILFARRADVSAPAERLRAVAQTPEQICTLARADLAQGDPRSALLLAIRGLHGKPSSWLCRRCEQVARKLLAKSRSARRSGRQGRWVATNGGRAGGD